MAAATAAATSATTTERGPTPLSPPPPSPPLASGPSPGRPLPRALRPAPRRLEAERLIIRKATGGVIDRTPLPVDGPEGSDFSASTSRRRRRVRHAERRLLANRHGRAHGRLGRGRGGRPLELWGKTFASGSGTPVTEPERL